MSSYPIPQKRIDLELEIKRSRFITTLIAAADPQAVTTLLQELRLTYPDASHHCWAYVIGAPKSSACVGMSDDGEPKGTAGRPMLNVLLHADVGDVAVVVTRYFGGTKLGTGGLVHAYSDCVKAALLQVTPIMKIHYQSVTLTCRYDQIDGVMRLTERHAGQIDSQDYQQHVTLKLNIPKDQRQAWRQSLPFDVYEHDDDH